MARYDDLNTSTIGFATVFSALLLIVIIVGMQGLSYYWENSENERKKDRSEYTESLKVLKEQADSLGQYEWVAVPAPEAGPGETQLPPSKRLQIPINRAKELILNEMKGGNLAESASAKPGA
jgi:hypothetical protein